METNKGWRKHLDASRARPPNTSRELELDWMLFSACSELEVEESDRFFFCGRGQARLAPLMIEGHPIPLLAATEEGVSGHLIIMDGS